MPELTHSASPQPLAFREGDVVRNKHTGALLTVCHPASDWEPFYYELVSPAQSAVSR